MAVSVTDFFPGQRKGASAFWFLGQPRARPKALSLHAALTDAGELTDTTAGRKKYAEFLAWQAVDGPAGRNKAYVSLSKGWALGTQGFKSALVKDHALVADARAWETGGAREIREQQWQDALEKYLQRAGRTLEAARSERKSAPWKIAIAAEMKQATHVNNGWIAARLNMGSGVAVSQYVGRWRRGLNEGLKYNT